MQQDRTAMYREYAQEAVLDYSTVRPEPKRYTTLYQTAQDRLTITHYKPPVEGIDYWVEAPHIDGSRLIVPDHALQDWLKTPAVVRVALISLAFNAGNIRAMMEEKRSQKRADGFEFVSYWISKTRGDGAFFVETRHDDVFFVNTLAIYHEHYPIAVIESAEPRQLELFELPINTVRYHLT